MKFDIELLLVLICVYFDDTVRAQGTLIVRHPKSRLVPIGVEVTFTCIISGPEVGSHIHWNMNSVALLSGSSAKRRREQEGFVFDEQIASSIATLTLRVNATADKSGTRIYCSLLSTHSTTATLLIIAEPPLLENPYFEYPNASSIILKWSPPYLWPAQAIDYYNISVFESYNNVLRDRVDTTFSEAVVSWQPAEKIKETQTCTPLTFVITAVSSDSDLVPVSITGGYLTTNRENSTLSVNITILFKADLSPLAMVKIKFPPTICSYERFRYSIMTGNDNITKVHGPYQHYGSVDATHMISSDLRKDKVYTLTVVANTSAGEVASRQFKFNTKLHLPDLLIPTVHPPTEQLNSTECTNVVAEKSLQSFLYEVWLYIFVGVTILLLLILTTLSIYCCATQHRGRKDCNDNMTSQKPICDLTMDDSKHQKFKFTMDPPITMDLPTTMD